MKARIAVIFLLAWTAVIASPSAATACSCVVGSPICETFWRTDAVFSGEVVDISSAPGVKDQLPLGNRLVRIRVIQAWRGGASGIVEVRTGSGGGDCGYNFQQGVRYLVFASQWSGTLSTGICSPTRRLDEASAELAFLEGAAKPSAIGRIFGSVRYQRDPDDESSTDRPLGGYEVELSNGRKTWKATSAADGGFEFNVPAGAYTIKLNTPGIEHAYGPSSVAVADARGCAAADFYVVPDGRVAVRVVDKTGAPRPGLSIEMIAIDRPGITGRLYVANAQTDADGIATFAQLRPRRYVLALNAARAPGSKQPFATSYFPGVTTEAAAQIVDVALGERVDAGDWIVAEALRERTINGLVLWPDGKPAAGVQVTLWRVATSRSPSSVVDQGSALTDQKGTFTFPAYEGEAYDIRAFAPASAPDIPMNATAKLSRRDSNEPVKLVLTPITRR
jgi:5-hydroxyisourate hydrolase-like protein (transthyretin family)